MKNERTAYGQDRSRLIFDCTHLGNQEVYGEHRKFSLGCTNAQAGLGFTAVEYGEVGYSHENRKKCVKGYES